MVSDLFSTLLEEVASQLKVRELKPDSNHSCLMKLVNGALIQLELGPNDQLLLGSDLGALPAGSLRKEFFEAALTANGQPPPLHGILAYTRNMDHLTLFAFLPLLNLTGEKIVEELMPFSEKAIFWRDALSHRAVPTINRTPPSPGGLFGLIR